CTESENLDAWISRKKKTGQQVISQESKRSSADKVLSKPIQLQQTSLVQFCSSSSEENSESKTTPQKHAFVKLELPQADVFYYPSVISLRECDQFYSDLSFLTYWSRPTFKIFGRPSSAPRLTCSFGSDPDRVYRYSGTTARVDSLEYHPSVRILKEKIESILNVKFNFVLLNWYKNGDDYIGEHSDDERDLVRDGVIACVYFGKRLIDGHERCYSKTLEAFYPKGKKNYRRKNQSNIQTTELKFMALINF
ncbi:7873_t:CDS:2, partial [Acaulospora morrowiae]